MSDSVFSMLSRGQSPTASFDAIRDRMRAQRKRRGSGWRMNLKHSPASRRSTADEGEEGMKCGACRFWEPDEETDYEGVCRRRAPEPLFLHALSRLVEAASERHDVPGKEEEGLRRYPYWPRTDNVDWCGEFEPKPAKQPGSPDEPQGKPSQDP